VSESLMDFIAQWWLPAAIVAGGVVAGLVVERVVLVEVRRLMERTPFTTPGRVVKAVRGATAELVILASGYVAVAQADIGADAKQTARNVLFVLVMLVVTAFAARLAGAALKMYMERSEGPIPSSSIFVNIVRILVFVLGFLIVMQHFGISITPILTALGVGGIAVALALQPTLAGLFSGVQILAARQIRPGDLIELEGGQSGEVVDITWRNTIIRTLPNNEVIIPNETMASSIVTNYQLPEGELSVLLQCGVAYDSDLELVERVVCEEAASCVRELGGEFEDWEPLVRFHTFGDSAIEFTIVLRAAEFRDQYLLKHEFIKRLHRRFDAEGIEIPFPQRVVHRPGDGATIG
jgi:small-conductance mechanosensitive channel